MNDFRDILDKIPTYIKKYLRVPIYLHLVICVVLLISLLFLVYYTSYNNFSNKTIILQEQELRLKQQIKKYYEGILDIKNKQICINKFILNNTINKREESKLLSDIGNIANNNEVSIISVIPNYSSEQDNFTVFYNNYSIAVTICYLAITVSATDSSKLINFVNNLINQKYTTVVDKFEVIKQGNGALQGFLFIETYCL